LLLAFNQISNNAGMLRIPPAATSKFHGDSWLAVLDVNSVQNTPSVEAYFRRFRVWWLTSYNAKGLLKAAIRDDNPVLFFEHVLLYLKKICQKKNTCCPG